MTSKSEELVQGNGGTPTVEPQPENEPQPDGSPEDLLSKGSNSTKVFKSGPLFISSKGIGWTSWKKRWFVLTSTSLVFFRSDPNIAPQKGNEVNLTLGGIDLNNSGSVIVKADKKLLTVQFPDVNDGRAFTLKAETNEDLYEWKTALENALAQAPNPTEMTGQNGVLKNDQFDSLDNSSDQLNDKESKKSAVMGRPVLLALEDADGTPSFLEKAMRYIEEHGVKAEGILRQAADVEQVEQRVREYEQGKVEFTENEDAHIIGDCIKHVLREMPSAPIPASCCKALLEASRSGRNTRVSAMRSAIYDTFPEPNRRLLQRILLMMRAVAAYKAANKMSPSAVAACMAPLLLRPLLAGECEIEHDFDVGGDSSAQLLQAAAAANHAQAIVITLLEEYDAFFGEDCVSPGPDMYTDSDESESGSEEFSDEDMSYEEDYDEEEGESIEGSEIDEEDGTGSESGGSNVTDDDKDHAQSSSTSKSLEVSKDREAQKIPSNKLEQEVPQQEACANDPSKPPTLEGAKLSRVRTTKNEQDPNLPHLKKSSTLTNAAALQAAVPAPQRRTLLGRTAAKKNHSMESIHFEEEDFGAERLESLKRELQNQIVEEAKENSKLQSDLQKRKEALPEHHSSLEREVAILKEQLRKEKSSRATLEAGLKVPPGPLSKHNIDEKVMSDLEELLLVEEDLSRIKRKLDELRVRLSLLGQGYGSGKESTNQPQHIIDFDVRNTQDAEGTIQYERSTTKDYRSGGAEHENDTKHELKHLSSKKSSSKKYGAWNEQATNSQSANALTKLTSKLSFLNDRREPNNSTKVEKIKGAELHPPLASPKKSRGFEFYLPLSSSSKHQGYDFHMASKGAESGQHGDKLKKMGSQTGQRHLDKQNQYLRRGMSERESHHQPLENVQ
ncbi:hypothetical protein PIB30_050439 [Stylosanthes scabra]|uniref:Uncharacterized protein n=1 Tax=Stylosanthes scabra TaxID=79078 RepID=A0ABU6RHR3_9FABA|nr:hypothetical protein [Stylosanthes scabra]